MRTGNRSTNVSNASPFLAKAFNRSWRSVSAANRAELDCRTRAATISSTAQTCSRCMTIEQGLGQTVWLFNAGCSNSEGTSNTTALRFAVNDLQTDPLATLQTIACVFTRDASCLSRSLL